MTGPEGNSEFCFPRISMFPETKSRETLRFENKNQILKNALNIRPPPITFNSGQHFAGKSELFPVWRHSFRNVARSWHLARNSFIIRCRVTIKRAVTGKTPALASTISQLFFVHSFKSSKFLSKQTRIYQHTHTHISEHIIAIFKM